MKEKLKAFFSDSVWSIAGLMLMNVTAQFVVYPIWNARLGNEGYGVVLYLLSLMNIFAISIGSGCNYARMLQGQKGERTNGTYTRILALTSALIVPLGLLPMLLGNVEMTPVEAGLFTLLAILTMWRFYADVEYRLSLNYKGYFLYYLVISIGYGVGVGLFLLTGLWPLALLPGEIAGLAMVWFRGSLFKKHGKLTPEEQRAVIRAAIILLATDLVNNIIFNGDRLILKNVLDATAVTIFYQASLLGKTVSLVTTPLNSVIIGYLMRYKGGLTAKIMHGVTAGMILTSLLGTAACTVASHVLIHLLYPQNYALVKEFFIIANLGQVVYFVSNIFTVVLMRFLDEKYQVHINVAYALAFAGLCVPAAMFGGMWSFCWAMVGTSVIRLLACVVLGYLGCAGKLITKE